MKEGNIRFRIVFKHNRTICHRNSCFLLQSNPYGRTNGCVKTTSFGKSIPNTLSIFHCSNKKSENIEFAHNNNICSSGVSGGASGFHLRVNYLTRSPLTYCYYQTFRLSKTLRFLLLTDTRKDSKQQQKSVGPHKIFIKYNI